MVNPRVSPSCLPPAPTGMTKVPKVQPPIQVDFKEWPMVLVVTKEKHVSDMYFSSLLNTSSSRIDSECWGAKVKKKKVTKNRAKIFTKFKT